MTYDLVTRPFITTGENDEMTVVSRMLSSVYLLLTLLWGFCYGFVLLSSPAGAGKVFDRNFFPAGSVWNYNFRSSLLLKEKGGVDLKSVGFFIEGELLVKSIWSDDLKKLLEVQVMYFLFFLLFLTVIYFNLFSKVSQSEVTYSF